MKKSSKFFIVYVLMWVSVAAVYGQDCNSFLQRAAEAVSQKNYCDAKYYYQKYSECNADADVSTEIAMCNKYCKLQVTQGEENGNGDRLGYDSRTSSGTSRGKPSNNSRSNKRSFNGFQLHAGLFQPLPLPLNLYYNFGVKGYKSISSNGWSSVGGVDVIYADLSGMSFWGFPITIGGNYACAVNNSFSIYGEVSAGFRFTATTIKNKSYDATNFTSGLEAGALIAHKYTIGAKYHIDTYDGGVATSSLSVALGILF